MNYISIDTETSGLDADHNQVLEFVAIAVRDQDRELTIEELPMFHRYLKWPMIVGQPKALAMNAKILAYIADGTGPDIILPDAFDGQFHDWLRDLGYKSIEEPFKSVTVAGKNFASFDQRFLCKITNVRTKHRVIDPMMLYVESNDIEPPDTNECLLRAGLPTEGQHDCVTDAQNVIRLLRAKGFQ